MQTCLLGPIKSLFNCNGQQVVGLAHSAPPWACSTNSSDMNLGSICTAVTSLYGLRAEIVPGEGLSIRTDRWAPSCGHLLNPGRNMHRPSLFAFTCHCTNTYYFSHSCACICTM